MKRLMLMGGRPWEAEDKGKAFTDALFRYTDEIKMAICLFAQPDGEHAETIKWNHDMFDSYKKNKKMEHKIMDKNNFEEVSEWANIIYIPGGDPFRLITSLKPYDLKKLWDGKVVAGSSAGADLLCANFPYLQKRTFGEGLGWVQASFIPHWRDDFKGYNRDDWDWAEQTSLKERPDLPVICVPEGEFVEITVA